MPGRKPTFLNLDRPYSPIQTTCVLYQNPMPEGCDRALAGKFGPCQSKRVQGGLTILVVLRVVGKVFAAPHAREPFAVLPVPINRLAQPLIEGDNGFPSEFGFYFLAVQGRSEEHTSELQS